MPWYVSRILGLGDIHPYMLPYGQFVLVDEKKNKREVAGWLPCHHANVEYELCLKNNGDIVSISSMRMTPKKNRAPVSAAAKKIQQGKLAPIGYSREDYLKQAEHAYKDQASWTVAVMYTHKQILRTNLNAVFACLTHDPESICTRGSLACKPLLMYDEDRAWKAVQRVLQTLGEPPHEDRQGFADRMHWQKSTRYATAALEAPSDNIRGVQRYQNLWTTQIEIDQARTIGRAMADDNCRIWLGTPCGKALKGRKSVVATLEEAFALKCFVSVDIYMVQPPFDETYRSEMGLPGIRILGKGEDVCIPWAHRWGVDNWLALIATFPRTFMCVGRLDQYTRGRGQVFRQMTESGFPCEIGHHYKMNDVEMVQTDDVAGFVHALDFPSVQCFSNTRDTHDIDTGRRWIKYPSRIRTLTDRKTVRKPRVALCEEYFTHEYKVGANASVASVRQVFTPVDVGVYICSEETSAFDIHVARTLCRHKLYVVNCTTSPFAWKHQAPPTLAVNPFL